MIIKYLLVLVLLLRLSASSRCTDNSQCFLKYLFDFSYPQEGVYNISLGSEANSMNYKIRAYGDFNNDLRIDYLAIDSSNRTLVYIYND